MRFYLGSRRKNLKGTQRVWQRWVGSDCGMVVLALFEKKYSMIGQSPQSVQNIWKR